MFKLMSKTIITIFLHKIMLIGAYIVIDILTITVKLRDVIIEDFKSLGLSNLLQGLAVIGGGGIQSLAV